MKKIFLAAILTFTLSGAFAQQTAVDSLKRLLKGADAAQKVQIYEKLAYEIEIQDSVLFYLVSAKNLALEENLDSLADGLFSTLQIYFFRKGVMDSVLVYLERHLEFYENTLDTNRVKPDYGEIYLRYGVAYGRMSKFDKSVEYYTKAATIYDEENNVSGLASVNLNIGNIYFYYLNTDSFKTAIKFYELAQKNAAEVSNLDIYIRSQINQSQAYKERKDFDKAIEIINSILKFSEENAELMEKEENLMFEVYSTLGGIYIEKDEFQLAEKNLLKAMNDFEDVFENRVNTANIYGSMALLYNKWGKTTQAIDYYEKAIGIYNELGYKKEIADNYKELSQLYAKQSNYKKSLEYFQSYADLKDSLFNADVSQQINEMQAKYESDKKQKEIELLTKDQEKQELFNNAIIAVAILILIVAFFVYRSYLIKKKANILLEQQNIEIREQKEQIEEQKQEITDSIKYASRIQRAVLPPTELFDELFPEYFILFRPRDIVSGDFYWAARKENKIYVAAADCTGHGVPGAFMSMLGISFLNEIVSKTEINSASEILDRLRENVIDSLRQTGKANEAKDGMDIALCVIDRDNMKVEFAGAYNPLLIVRNGEIIQVKADKMPIGIYFKEHTPFSNNEVEVQSGDVLYLFSDGYIDQFGGPSGRKFMINKFKELLASLHSETLTKQRDILDVKIDMWRGDRPQIDDIIVLGIKI